MDSPDRFAFSSRPIYRSQYLKKPDSLDSSNVPNGPITTTMLPNYAKKPTFSRFSEQQQDPVSFTTRPRSIQEIYNRDADRISRLAGSRSLNNQDDNDKDGEGTGDLPVSNILHKRFRSISSGIRSPFESPKIDLDDDYNGNLIDLIGDEDSPIKPRRAGSRSKSSNSSRTASEISTDLHTKKIEDAHRSDQKHSSRFASSSVGEKLLHQDRHVKPSSYRALQLDYMMVRQMMEDIQERLDELQRGENSILPDKKETIARKKWLDDLESTTVGTDDKDIKKQEMEQTLHKMMDQIQTMEKRIASASSGRVGGVNNGFSTWSSDRSILPVKYAQKILLHPVSLFVLSILFIIAALYIHMLYFDDEEQAVRRSLGPDFYRVGWLEYSTRVF